MLRSGLVNLERTSINLISERPLKRSCAFKGKKQKIWVSNSTPNSQISRMEKIKFGEIIVTRSAQMNKE
jgi:hypothetical protein